MIPPRENAAFVWRSVEVTERRRKQEFAEQIRRLAEEDHPHAKKICVVLDNLSTHTASAFYEAFSPEQARRLARRIEFVLGLWGACRVAQRGEALPLLAEGVQGPR